MSTKSRRKSYPPGEDPRPAVKALARSTLKAMGQELALGHTEYYDRFLRSIATFRNYSANNQRLLAEQCFVRKLFPNYIAKRSAWQDLGYAIEEGQTCLYVWAPKKKKRTHSLPMETTPQENEEDIPPPDKCPSVQSGFPYILVPVFGDCQLAKTNKGTGQPYPPPPAFRPSFPEDRNACYECLLQAANALGCNVTETYLRKAYGTNSEKEICIDPRQDSTNRLITLAHELAHSLLHWGPNRGQLTKKVKECHAQATAEVVVSYMGIKQSWTRDYLLSFQVTPADLERELEIISEAACAIIYTLHSVVDFSPPIIDEEGIKRNLVLV